MQFLLFTDNLSDLSIPEACRAAKRAGFDGIDLTLRPGGHVKPENADVGLSEAKRIADAEGVLLSMVTTAIVDATEPHAEAVFAAAAHYGARRLKLGYWPYRPFGTLAEQVAEVRRKLEGLARLGEKYRVLPCVHPHSGPFVAAGGFLLYLLLKDFKPGEVGAYVDPMHMSIEGGVSGWELALDLVGPWIALCGVKNYRWVATARDAKGQMRYRWEYVPLAEGQAPVPEFFGRLRDLRYDGLVSFHSEYKGETSWRRLSTPDLLEQSAADLRHLKSLLK